MTCVGNDFCTTSNCRTVRDIWKITHTHTYTHKYTDTDTGATQIHARILTYIHTYIYLHLYTRTVYGVHCTAYTVWRTLYGVHCTPYKQYMNKSHHVVLKQSTYMYATSPSYNLYVISSHTYYIEYFCFCSTMYDKD